MGSFRPPTRAPLRIAAPTPPPPASPQPITRAPTQPPIRTAAPTPPPPGPTPPSPETRLSASGEIVTEYSGTRESGWRDAGSEAIDASIRQHLDGGRKGAAARIAWDAGRFEQALEWFRELGMHFHAGACLRSLGRFEEALEALLAVPADAPQYRRACFELVPTATAVSRIDFDVDRYFTRFVEEGPKEPEEIPIFLELAALYRAAEFPRGALRCAVKVLALDPTNAKAAALQKELGGREEHHSAAPAAPAQRGLPELPTIEEFVRLARAHSPARR